MAVTTNYGAAPTYVKLASNTLSGAAASITFSNVPQSYTDLILVVDYSLNVSNSSLFVRLNGDTGSNYSYTRMSGTGSAASSGRGTSSDQARITADTTAQSASTRQIVTINLMNYNNSTTYKTFLSRYNSTGGVEAFVDLWRSTAAVTSVQIKGYDGTAIIESGATFTLYGIKAAFVPKATGGDIIVQDGSYWYHAFRSTSSFTPKQSLTADVLQIAGGGAGGSSQTGAAYQGTGGGAGGVSYVTSQSLTANTVYTTTVGAGGAGGGQTYPFRGANGSNSQFGSVTAAVGGGGGIYYGVEGQGLNGGSGSGGSGQHNTPTPGLGTSGQGNNGGVGVYGGGGGGGAGGVGGNSGWSAAIQQAGVGGVGTTTYSSWGLATGTGQNVSGTVYYAGGGGGGFSDGYGTPSNYNNGSYGGGGIGGSGGINSPVGQYAQLAGAGIANTGGGGGGGGANLNTVYAGGFNGAAGGSGLVIVRYPI